MELRTRHPQTLEFLPGCVSLNAAKVTAILDSFRGSDLDPRYLGFFECFNQQLFFEAHEVLEELWLAERGRAKDLFYKALIQIAGAFVHVQKNRSQPATSLLKLARTYLGKYPPVYERLDLAEVGELMEEWLGRLASPGTQPNSLFGLNPPRLALTGESGSQAKPIKAL